MFGRSTNCRLTFAKPEGLCAASRRNLCGIKVDYLHSSWPIKSVSRIYIVEESIDSVSKTAFAGSSAPSNAVTLLTPQHTDKWQIPSFH